MDTSDIAKIILESNTYLDLLEEDLTAEKYFHLTSTEKFILKSKWAKEQLELNKLGIEGNDHIKSKLNKFDLPLKRTMIKVFIDNKYFDKYETPEKIAECFNITSQEVKRLLKKRDKEEYQIFSFIKVSEILKGNEYIEE